MGSSVSSRLASLPQWSGRPSPRRNLPVPGQESGRVWTVERWLVRRLLGAVGNPPIALVLWNGEAIGHAAPKARLIIHDRRTFWQLLANVYLSFGDAFSDGRVEVEGDLLEFLEIVYRSEDAEPPHGLAAALAQWRRKPRANTLGGSRSNIYHHYDIGDDFYRLWLDREMVYTCAFFPSPESFAGRSPGGQDGTGLPQALAQAGGDGGRGGMRLGSVGALHGAALRREGEGL